MSTISATIGGVSVTIRDQSFTIVDGHGVRSTLSFVVIDAAGAFSFFQGQPVVFTDSATGNLYKGTVSKSIPEKPSPLLPLLLHTVTIVDTQRNVDKRINVKNYAGFFAGDIIADSIDTTLYAEGITAPYSRRLDTLVTDWNQGTLANALGTQTANGSVGDGQLQLAKAGSDLTINENTTALFAAGTLTACTATSNTLVPSTVSGLKVVTTLPFTQVNADMQVNIWQGSKALGTNDTLNFSIFIASTSPSIKCSVGLLFNDGTTSNTIIDQNGFAIDETTDLMLKAKDQWYTRAISTTTYNGKTISSVYVAFGGTVAGTYTCYVQNVYLSSSPGSPFFSTTAIAPQLNPVVVQSSAGYAASSVIATVVPVINPFVSTRISPSYNIDSVTLLMSSSITWLVSGVLGGCAISASYDGGVTYQPCVNGSALPALPVGSSVAGLTLTLLETFTIGTLPTTIPILQSVIVTLVSAPNATKSDIVKPFTTQAQWNTGTKTGVVALANGDLTTGGINSGWAQGQILNETFLASSGTSKSAKDGVYINVVPVDLSANKALLTRFDFAGTLTLPFSIDFDCTLPTTYNYSSWIYVDYLQTYWGDTNGNHAAYQFAITQNSSGSQNVILWRGTNSNSGTATQLSIVSQPVPNHVRITVDASHVHNIYFDGNPTPVMTVTDSTYTSGQVAILSQVFQQNPGGGGFGTFTYKNVVVSPLPTETWLGPSTSISTLGSCGSSVISWTETNTLTSNGSDAAIFVESSIDGGTSYQTCTSGQPIPNLTPGMSVAGLSVKLLISFYASTDVLLLPIIRQLVWRVLGPYPGASGTRTTVPIVNDYPAIVRTVGSGWGTAFDGQTWAQVGTGTTSVGSGEALIVNTTGDVHMVPGSNTWTDEDATIQMKLSASTMQGGLELRYTNANNYYRLAISTTAISIIKRATSITTTLITQAATYAAGTEYSVRFRVVGSSPVLLYGRTWLTGTPEPTTWTITGSG